MFAIIAAVIFAIGLLLDMTHNSLGTVITANTLLLAGLLCVALHLAGVGAAVRTGGWRRTRR
jgi:hypothetical protein